MDRRINEETRRLAECFHSMSDFNHLNSRQESTNGAVRPWIVLALPAWHFHLSTGPILEDKNYAQELAAVCFVGDAGLGTSRTGRASAAAGPGAGGARGHIGVSPGRRGGNHDQWSLPAPAETGRDKGNSGKACRRHKNCSSKNFRRPTARRSSPKRNSRSWPMPWPPTRVCSRRSNWPAFCRGSLQCRTRRRRRGWTRPSPIRKR